jgi:hypothetical protein
MAHRSYREETRKNWGTELDGPLTIEQVSLGCQLRIADAVEKMASNYTALQDERDRYKRYYQEELETGRRRANQIAGLKGAITKIKKQAKKG